MEIFCLGERQPRQITGNVQARQISTDGECISGRFPGVGDRELGGTGNGHSVFGVTKTFWNSIMVMVVQPWEYTKSVDWCRLESELYYTL